MLEMCGKHLRRRFAVKAKQSGWVPTTEKHPGIGTKLGTNVRVGTIAQAVVASKIVDFRVPMRRFFGLRPPLTIMRTKSLSMRKHPAISSGFLFLGVRAYVSTIRKRTRAHYFPRHFDGAHTADL